jgi:hypothetical protein
VLLDSGAYTLNNAAAPLLGEELTALVGRYEDFVQLNAHAVDYVIEMDALALGPVLMRNHRDTLRDIAGDRAVAVWHPQDGLAELMLMAERWPNIALGTTELDGRDLTPTLVSLAHGGVKLFGMAMTKPDLMRSIPWYSVHSTSWLSPSQYGDTVIWSRGALKRYHKRQKDEARRRHRTEIELAGFDPQLVAEDEISEVLKVSLWSWRQQLAAINMATTSGESLSRVTTETDAPDVDTDPPAVRNEMATTGPRQRPVIPLPGVAVELVEHEHKDSETGAREVRELPLLRSSGGSMMACDTCYVKDVCPKAEPGAACAYNVDVEVRTEEQVDALLRMLIEHETSDYLRERFEAELTGGGDRSRPQRGRNNISRLLKFQNELHETGFSVTIKGRSSGHAAEPGFLSRIGFGQPLAIAPREVTPPIYEQLGILDAELVESAEG